VGDLPDQGLVTNTVSLSDSQALWLQAAVTTRVQSSNLSNSYKSVTPTLVLAGDLVTYTLGLINSGEISTMLQLTDPLPAGVAYQTGSLTGGATYDPLQRQIQWSGTLGAAITTTAGYKAIDSRTPGGPSFDWQDISTTGTPVSLGDDAVVGPLQIGFDFPFFGDKVSQFWISSNGWIAFSAPSSSYLNNVCLPSDNAPPLSILAFWDDLNPGAGGRIYYQTNNTDTLIVSWVSVPRFGGNGPYTFEIVLKADGRILLQYQTMNPPVNSASVGLEQRGLIGLGIACNDNYVQNNLAVLFTPETGNSEHTIQFLARIEPTTTLQAWITNTMTVVAASGLSVERSAGLRVNPVELEQSSLQLSPTLLDLNRTAAGEVRLVNSGKVTAPAARAIVAFSDRLIYEEGSASTGAVYDPVGHQLTWVGPVTPTEPVTVTFRARPDIRLADGERITLTAQIDDGLGTIRPLAASVVVRRADLSESSLTTHLEQVQAGNPVAYTVQVVNRGTGSTTAQGRVAIPSNASLVSGSLWSYSGTVEIITSTQEIVWRGWMPGRSIANWGFALTPQQAGDLVTRLSLDDGQGTVLTRSVSVRVFLPPYHLYLPLTVGLDAGVW